MAFCMEKYAVAYQNSYLMIIFLSINEWISQPIVAALLIYIQLKTFVLKIPRNQCDIFSCIPTVSISEYI